jgi:hypothetical protein
MFCVGCGQSLPDDARFCSKCGRQIVVDQTPAPLPSYAQALIDKAPPERRAAIEAAIRRPVPKDLIEKLADNLTAPVKYYDMAMEGPIDDDDMREAVSRLKELMAASTRSPNEDNLQVILQAFGYTGDTYDRLSDRWYSYVDDEYRSTFERESTIYYTQGVIKIAEDTEVISPYALGRVQECPALIRWLDEKLAWDAMVMTVHHGLGNKDNLVALNKRMGKEFILENYNAAIEHVKQVYARGDVPEKA